MNLFAPMAVVPLVIAVFQMGVLFGEWRRSPSRRLLTLVSLYLISALLLTVCFCSSLVIDGILNLQTDGSRVDVRRLVFYARLAVYSQFFGTSILMITIVESLVRRKAKGSVGE